MAISFKGVSFDVVGMPVNHLNFVGFFIAFLGVFALVICNTMLHDCSAEFDLKDFLRDDETERSSSCGKKESCDDDSTSNDAVNHITDVEENGALLEDFCKNHQDILPLKSVIKGLFSSPEALLIFISTFILVFSLFGTDVLIPLLIENTFHWPMDVTSYVFISYGIGYFIILVVMSTFFTSRKSVYVATIVCLVCMLLQYVILATLVLLTRNKNRDIALFVLFLFCWLIGWCLDAVLLRTLIANMVPSNIQSFTETLRSGAARISTILASFIFPLVTNYLHWTCVLMFGIMFFILLGFLSNFKQYLHPKEILFSTKMENCKKSSHLEE